MLAFRPWHIVDPSRDVTTRDNKRAMCEPRAQLLLRDPRAERRLARERLLEAQGLGNSMVNNDQQLAPAQQHHTQHTQQTAEQYIS